MPVGRKGGLPFGVVLAFVVLVAAAFVLFQVGDIGLEQGGTEQASTTNETLVVSYSNSVRVSAATSRYTRGFEDNETVYNASGAELAESTDYDFNTTTGAVTFFNTTNTTDGENANITYTYSQNVDSVRNSEPILRTVISAVGGPLVFMPLVTFAGVLLIAFAWYIKRSLTPARTFGGGR